MGDAGGKAFAGEQQPILQSDTPDGYCGSHVGVLSKSPTNQSSRMHLCRAPTEGRVGCDGGIAGYQSHKV